MLKFISIFFTTLLLISCAGLQNQAKYQLVDGKYSIQWQDTKYSAYIQNVSDSIIIHQPELNIHNAMPQYTNETQPVVGKISKTSVDVDIMTSVFKIRPNTTNLPAQMNSNLNGNLYFGLRNDIYSIKYKNNPLYKYQRIVNHIGFGGGVFVGLGNTAINASTAPNQPFEYDGIVFQNGIAGLFAINKLTVGLSVGKDRLFDKSLNSWEYQNSVWYGLMLGLNLN
jgi:hypothetical protein